MPGADVSPLDVQITFLKGQLVTKDQQIAIKDKQIEAKDGQIAALIERDRETNVLMQAMQQILRPLLPAMPDVFRRDDTDPGNREGQH